IVGMSAQIGHDVQPTPVDENMYGPVLHLHTLAAALDREFLHEVPFRADYVFILVAAVLAWMVVAFVRRPLFCILILAGVVVAYLIAARVLYDRGGLLIIVVPTMVVFGGIGLLGLVFEYALE